MCCPTRRRLRGSRTLDRAERGARVHKTANVLNKLLKSLQTKARSDLKDIWMIKTRIDAEATFDLSMKKYGVARKLAAIPYCMWRNGTEFPFGAESAAAYNMFTNKTTLTLPKKG